MDGQMDNNKEFLTKREQLKGYFNNFGTARENWRVGTEFEKLGVFRSTGEAVPYEGKVSIKGILEGLAAEYNWIPMLEDGKLLGLKRGDTYITLEPGAQLEFVGSPCRNLHESNQEVQRHIHEIVELGEPQGIIWLGYGVHPVSTVNDVKLIPKKRYEIMYDYFNDTGTHGRNMMKLTAAVQVSFDYDGESDMAAKVRLVNGASSIVTALFSNSPISESRDSGFASYRCYIWNNTDPSRCGLLREVFSPDFGFETYTDYVIDVPMFFVRNGDSLVPVRNFRFRDFMEKGFEGRFPTIEDWELHLSTIFTEVRMKKYLEVRCGDNQCQKLLMAIPAFWKGLLYDREALDAAWKVVSDWTWEERLELHEDICRKGVNAAIRGKSVLDIARELYKISSEGLRRQACYDNNDHDERIYLEKVDEIIFARESSPANRVLNMWENEWHRNIDNFLNHCRYDLLLDNNSLSNRNLSGYLKEK